MTHDQKSLQTSHNLLSFTYKSIASQLLHGPLLEVDIFLLAKDRKMIVSDSVVLIKAVDVEYGCDVSLLYSL